MTSRTILDILGMIASSAALTLGRAVHGPGRAARGWCCGSKGEARVILMVE